MRRSSTALLSFALALGLAACESNYSGPYETFPESEADLSFGPGDVFDVRVFNEKELSDTYRVGPNGAIDFPLIGEVTVQGKLPTVVAKEIRDRLADGYLKRPQVSVFPKEYNSKRISIIGAVSSPGTFLFNERMSIVEGITRAGGFTSMAKKDSVAVTRMVNGQKMKKTIPVGAISSGKSPNFFLQPGDLVYVPERTL